LRGQLGLGLVIVDVVFDDHALLGRLARLELLVREAAQAAAQLALLWQTQCSRKYRQ
jgi:hypothetical protein